MRHCWLVYGVFVLLLAPLSGCKQGEGDRCQLDSDCEDGLVCCVDPAKADEGGICRPSGRCDLTPKDSGPDGETTDSKLTSDGELDLTFDLPPTDLPLTDLPPTDLPPTDTKSEGLSKNYE